MGSRTNAKDGVPTRRKPNKRQKTKTAAFKGGSSSTAAAVSVKLAALKSLLPRQNDDVVNADTLFQQTADYIMVLRTQVSILQQLVDFYGSGTNNSVVEE